MKLSQLVRIAAALGTKPRLIRLQEVGFDKVSAVFRLQPGRHLSDDEVSLLPGIDAASFVGEHGKLGTIIEWSEVENDLFDIANTEAICALAISGTVAT